MTPQHSGIDPATPHNKHFTKPELARISRKVSTALSSGNAPASLWTMADLSHRLNLCDRATRNLIQKGLIPKIRLTGKALRFDPIQVERALAKLTVGGVE